ncbi:acyl-CoA dehydrogenase family protein [Conexibacter sp. DBS9H8]|uniref:acyl-CoA dehydrogenase family protein n=1 Tax=Conexibacter sp. DBS9H8 TaxID=2937801 RepID=UPI00200CA040|nr:acyl-CoA dehydrogenase family protein [Conexibacter sp. DBS9H8]
MNFELTPRAAELRARLEAFMDERVYPAEPIWAEQVRAAATPHVHAPIIEELKAEARERGLWNLFLPDAEHGAGLSNCEYAPLAEVMGRTKIAAEICNCNAPDTGNMEVLQQFGTEEQKQRWLIPLLDGEIRSAFAMTEPDVASSDATQIATSIVRDGDEYVINGRKWWTTNALHPNLAILIVMGKTDPEAATYAQQSMVLVPIDTPGVTVKRSLPVFGYHDTEGHGELEFADVRVPVSNILAGEGMGFMIAQARLGPGRIHHCMRAIGLAERALELMCARADARFTFGKPISANANIRDWIAESRIELEMARLLVWKTAWLMDTVGNQHARIEISGIKFAVPEICLRILDRAIQVHGGGGVSDDFPLAMGWAMLRTLRLADGPDEVHKLSLARQELRRQRERRGDVSA